MRLIDLTHTFDESLPLFPGDPRTELIRVADLDAEGFIAYRLQTGLHTGTHMDAPLHVLEDGSFLSEVPVEKFFGRGVLIDARQSNLIGTELLEGYPIRRGDVVLVMTGFDKYYRDEAYFDRYPEVTEAFADALLEAGVSMLGLDTPSPDRYPFPVHRLLLGRGMLIVENLTNLESLLGVSEFEVVGLPLKIRAEAAPVRVIAQITKE